MPIVNLTSFADNRAVLNAIYAGDIFRIQQTPDSTELVRLALSKLKREFGAEFRKAQFSRSISDFSNCVTALKQIYYSDAQYLDALKKVITQIGFDPLANAVDPLRFRAVLHDGHLNREAIAAYSLHRDTWYANSQSQVNWWIPLHDVTEAETFTFYPEYFNRPVENSSDSFDYDKWKVAVGFGNSNRGRAELYPSTSRESIDTGSAVKFSCRAGDIVLFSAAHLHATNPNSSGLTRFSVDFRTVHLADHFMGLGAPNVDNRSSGSALADYVHPAGSSQAKGNV